MTSRFAFAVCGFLVCLLGQTSSAVRADASSRREAATSLERRPPAADLAFGQPPLSFEPNRGQFASRSLFGSRGPGYTLAIDRAGATLALQGTSPSESHGVSMRLQLVGARAAAGIRGDERLPGVANYFSGVPSQWITNVPTYGRVVVENAYDGVDVIYRGNHRQLEYDFIVQPHVSPDVIQLEFPGASSVAIAANGDLAIAIGGTTIRQSAPHLYQVVEGRHVTIDGGYVLGGGRQVGFRAGSYDRAVPLVIDPQLTYSTYSGGMNRPYGIGVDVQGNVYIAGTTWNPSSDAKTNAYVAKLNAAGTAFLWAASFGQFGASASATAIAVDASGNAHVTGWTEIPSIPGQRQFPILNAIQPTPGGSSDAFVTTFDPNGRIVRSTYVGGNADERADGIAVDASGRIFVTGQTSSPDFPTVNAFQPAPRGGSDAFVSVLNADGSAFVYSTYAGGSAADRGLGIAVDSSGNAYVTGSTASADFPTATPIRGASGGGLDAFVLELNATGAPIYSTYLGGSRDDIPTGIAVDASGSAYVSGRTNSPDFPTVAAFQGALHGGFDAFVTKVNAGGTAFAYSTYLGGSNDETTGGIWCEEKPTCGGIAVNGSGNAYITGVTASPEFPQRRSTQAFRGTTDAFVVELSADGSTLAYATLLGGLTDAQGEPNGFSSGSAIVWTQGTAYVAGLTNTTDFAITPKAADGPCASCTNNAWNGIDGFIAGVADSRPDVHPGRGRSGAGPVRH